MTIDLIKPNSSEKTAEEIYTYDGERPSHDLLLRGYYHGSGDEWLDCDVYNLMPGYDERPSGDERELDIDMLGEILPSKGVWIVTALGSYWSEKYWTDCGYEYDGGVNWDIVSANKFSCFGELKAFYKKWRQSNE